MAMEHEAFETLESQGMPLVRQLSVFLENRPGALLKLTQVFEEEDVKILGLSQVDAGDCAIVRLVFDRPDAALRALKAAEFPVHVSEILVVKLPPGKRAMMNIWSVLLMAEVNVAYAYPLLLAQAGSCLAVSVDCVEIALDTILRRKFEVLGEADLEL